MFKTLNQKQKLSLKHLSELGVTEPMKIIEWAVKQLARPNKHNHRFHPEERIPGPYRKHSKQHYQGIIDYLAQGNKLPG